MSKIICERGDLVAVADAVRRKTGETNELTLGEIVDGIDSIEAGNTDVEDGIVTRTLTTYSNDRVKSIGSYAFRYFSSLTTVNFPNCTTIGNGAFTGCSSLTTVSFPNCTNTGRDTFSNCNLITANFPACTTIGSYAFYSCKNLTTANFPACTTMESAAFNYCSALTTANFPVLTSIGSYAFNCCSNLTTLSFPNCETIGYGAFKMCDLLTSVTSADFPVCTRIQGSAFQYCSNLTSINVPNCTSIGDYAFKGCTSLTTLSFPNCTTISSSAFVDCSALSTISFPACTRVGSYAFFSCYNLTTANFPVLTSIETSAFQYCSNLTNLTIDAPVVCRLGNSSALGSTPIASGRGYIFVPSSLVASYKTATNWTYFSNRITARVPFILNDLKDKAIVFNTVENMSVNFEVIDSPPTTVSVVSSDESIATVSNIQITEQNMSFDIISNDIEGSTIIEIIATDSNHDSYTVRKTFVLTVYETLPVPSYEVDTSVSNSYTFELNNNDYYESTNKKKTNSYSLCKLNINAPVNCTMHLDCINYGENKYDYGILSNLDSTLSNSYSADSSYYKSFKTESSPSINTVTYNIPAGEHFIYIKYIKDSSSDTGNDSLQFKVRFEL